MEEGNNMNNEQKDQNRESKKKDVEKDDTWTHSESEFKYEESKKYDGGRFSWGVFFIFIGLVLLFNTTGILPWNVWGYLWRFWPLIFVLVGLSIIFDRSKWFGWIAFIISVLMFGTLLIFLLTTYNTTFLSDLGINVPSWIEDVAEDVDEISSNTGDAKEDTIVFDNEDFMDVEELDLVIEIGASEFEVVDSTNEDYLLKVESEYFENFGVPDIRDDQDDQLLNVEFEQQNRNPISGFNDENPFYSFQLGNDQIESVISVDLGAGRGTIDLDSTDLSSLEGNIGAGDMDISLSGEQIDGAKLTFDIGAGKVTLDLDDDVGYEISYNVGIGSLKIEGFEDGKVGGDGTLRSKNYDDVDVKVDIDLNVGVGSFELN